LSKEVEDLIAKKFIARSDVKAIQFKNGNWSPHQEFNSATGKHDGPRIPWRRQDLNAHVTGEATYGHYLLDTDSTCKLFAFDIDLEKSGILPFGENWTDFREVEDLRGAWLDRAHPARDWMKYQFKTIAHRLMRYIGDELDLHTAAAYSGGKGIHVYGFVEDGLKIPAEEFREGAVFAMNDLNFEAVKGVNFFKSKETDPESGFPNLSLELFPKQGSLDGKDLGNLMRLPLGRNLKSSDPTFFLDMTTPLADFRPVDPVWALTTDNPWKRPGD
jgi:hypothetical protein